MTGSVLDFDCQVPNGKSYVARFVAPQLASFFWPKNFWDTRSRIRDALLQPPLTKLGKPHPGAVLESLLKKKSHAEKVKTEIDVVTRSDGQHGHRNLV